MKKKEKKEVYTLYSVSRRENVEERSPRDFSCRLLITFM